MTLLCHKLRGMILGLYCLTSAIAFAQTGMDVSPAWKVSVLSSHALPGAGEVRTLRFDPATKNAFTMTESILRPDKVELKIVDQPLRDKEHATIKQAVLREKGFLGINGGYFDLSFQPDGWCVVDGKEITPPSGKKILSGLLSIPKGKKIPRLDLFSNRPAEVFSAIQTGPFLIDPGGKMGIRQKDGPLAPRTVIAQTAKSLVIITTSPITLYDLADQLTTLYVADEKIDRALNLDGGPSTGIFLQSGDYTIDEPEHWPVRNILVFKVAKH